MFIRLAWCALEQWHEPLVVGAAVTLISMSCLLPASRRAADRHAAANDGRQAVTMQISPSALPADDQYYREQWAREAEQFYARHRPRQSPGAPTLASATASSAPITGGEVVPAAAAVAEVPIAPPQVAQAYHSDHPSRSTLSQASAPGESDTGAAPPLSRRVRQWRVLSCVAAGALASLLFAALWPTATASTHSGRLSEHATADPLAAASRRRQTPAAGEAIEIRLPAAWVRVRPTMSQTLRRAVLGGSYLLAAIGSWSLLAQP